METACRISAVTCIRKEIGSNLAGLTAVLIDGVVVYLSNSSFVLMQYLEITAIASHFSLSVQNNKSFLSQI